MVVVWGILPLNILSLDKDKLCEDVVSIELREKVQNSASLLKVFPPFRVRVRVRADLSAQCLQ